MSGEERLVTWLRQVLRQLRATSGTVHLHENGGLRLAAAVNIPLAVQQIIGRVPSGKGMAGLALERRKPVETCNLQEDTSDNVRPGAKAVNARAAIAIPVEAPDGEVRAVVGIAFEEEREFTPADLEEITRAVSALPQ